MQFEIALNSIWVVLGVFALASTLRARRHRAGFTHAPVWLHLCGVALILAALFPYISATDDILRIQHMNVEQTKDPHQEPGKKVPGDTLIRLYETMDTPVVSVVSEISFVLFFISLVVQPLLRTAEHATLLQGGRSPPLLSV